MASKKIGKEVNADRTKYVIMAREQNAGRNHSIRIDSSLFESVDVLKYFGTSLTCQSSIEKKLRADLIQGMLVKIRCRFYFIQVVMQKFQHEYIQKYKFSCCFAHV